MITAAMWIMGAGMVALSLECLGAVVLLYLSADYQDQRRGLRFRGHSLSAFEHLGFERANVYKVHSDLTPFAS